MAFVSPYSWSRPGGVRTHITGLAAAFRARGIEVDVLAPVDGDVTFPGLVPLGRTVPIVDNGSVVRVALDPVAIGRTAQLVRSRDYDLLHLHEPMIPGVCLTTLLAARAPLVGTFHMYAPRPRWYRVFGALCRYALARLDARIAVSEAARRHVSRTCPGEYRIIPNGIDVQRFSAEKSGRDGTRLLFVGRADPRKGLPVLLEALKRLSGKPTLDLVGVEPRQLGRTGVRLPPGVAARIRAHGAIGDEGVARHLAAADILCAPSLRGESFGLVLVEGMAAGVPVVASAIPGYVDVLPPGCGRFVPPGDAAALATALAELLADGELRARLGAAGRREARRFDWSVVSEQILALYDEVLARRGRRRGSALLAPAPRVSPRGSGRVR